MDRRGRRGGLDGLGSGNVPVSFFLSCREVQGLARLTVVVALVVVVGPVPLPRTLRLLPPPLPQLNIPQGVLFRDGGPQLGDEVGALGLPGLARALVNDEHLVPVLGLEILKHRRGLVHLVLQAVALPVARLALLALVAFVHLGVEAVGERVRGGGQGGRDEGAVEGRAGRVDVAGVGGWVSGAGVGGGPSGGVGEVCSLGGGERLVDEGDLVVGAHRGDICGRQPVLGRRIAARRTAPGALPGIDRRQDLSVLVCSEDVGQHAGLAHGVLAAQALLVDHGRGRVLGRRRRRGRGRRRVDMAMQLLCCVAGAGRRGVVGAPLFGLWLRSRLGRVDGGDGRAERLVVVVVVVKGSLCWAILSRRRGARSGAPRGPAVRSWAHQIGHCVDCLEHGAGA